MVSITVKLQIKNCQSDVRQYIVQSFSKQRYTCVYLPSIILSLYLLYQLTCTENIKIKVQNNPHSNILADPDTYDMVGLRVVQCILSYPNLDYPTPL